VRLILGKVFLCVDGRDGALRNTHGAIDALVWIDGQEVGPFAEAVHGTDVHAVGILTFDTGFGNDVCHGFVLVTRCKYMILMVCWPLGRGKP